MCKITLFGDSISKGVIYDENIKRYKFTDNSFASLLSAVKNFDIKNFAKFGCTISKGFGIMEKHSLDIENSDYTVLEFGGNDSDYNWAQISQEPNSEHQPQTPLKDFSDKYTEIIRKLLKVGAKPILLNLPPIDEHKYFKWISKGLNKENILKWLGGSEEYIYRWHEMYNMEICKIAAENNVPLIDIRSPFLFKRNYTDYLCVDGIHLNELGHKLVNETLQKKLSAFFTPILT